MVELWNETARSRHEESWRGRHRVRPSPHQTKRWGLPCSTFGNVTGVPRLRRPSVSNVRHLFTDWGGSKIFHTVCRTPRSFFGRCLYLSSVSRVIPLRITSVLPPQWRFWGLDISIVVRWGRTLSKTYSCGTFWSPHPVVLGNPKVKDGVTQNHHPVPQFLPTRPWNSKLRQTGQL